MEIKPKLVLIAISVVILATCIPHLCTAQEAAGERVYVLGAVTSPGDFPFTPGMGAKEAIDAAGGLSANADLAGVILVRKNGENMVLNIQAILDGKETIALSAGDSIVVKPTTIRVQGLVKNPGLYDFKQGMTSADALTTAGGVQEMGALSAAYITRGGQQLSAGLSLPYSPIPLQPNDVLTVPELTASITGEVENPGTYTLEPGKSDNLDALIQKAGGLTIKADLKKVRISSVRGEEQTSTIADMSELNKRQSTTIRSGDVVFIPQSEKQRKHRISLNDILQVTLIIYTLKQIFGD